MGDLENQGKQRKHTDLRGTETVQFLCAEDVEVDWEYKADEESDQRDKHGDVIGVVVGDESRQ